MEQRIGLRICCLANKIKRSTGNIDAIVKLDKFTGTNGFIVRYIEKSKVPVYQKDIEKQFGITRSTASRVISLMEKKGILERKTVDSDARLKQLCLTPKSVELNREVVTGLAEFETKLMEGFTKEELDMLNVLLNKLERNLEVK